MRIGFAGGGTGGHVFPIQSLIKYIDKTSHAKHDLFWFGEKPSLEYDVVTRLSSQVAQLSFLRIFSGKRRREKELKALLDNIVDLFFLALGVLQSIDYILKNRIQIVFCKGGYVSLPVVIAAWLLKKPVYLHESDTQAGLANRICSRFAKVIFTGFSGVFPGREIVVGQILDDDLVSQTKDNTGTTDILVTGGSQGAQKIYESLLEIFASQKIPDNTHFHIVLGTQNASFKEKFDAYSFVTAYSFVDQPTMGGLLSQCDVAVTRGGTTSLAEQQLFGIKKIIIPLPWTHDQMKNALYYKNHHDDIVLDQKSDTFAKDFSDTILTYCRYTKGPYESPLSVIQETKKTILQHMLG